MYKEDMGIFNMASLYKADIIDCLYSFLISFHHHLYKLFNAPVTA